MEVENWVKGYKVQSHASIFHCKFTIEKTVILSFRVKERYNYDNISTQVKRDSWISAAGTSLWRAANMFRSTIIQLKRDMEKKK
jgi:hypothetical protein